MPSRNSIRWSGLCLPALLGLTACQPPNPAVPLAPLPSQDQLQAQAEVQTRTLPIARAQVFPRVLEVLMDMGFQIRSTDGALGQVNIYQAWEDPRYASAPHFGMEATLLFLDAGPGATRVRMAGTGNWTIWVAGKNLSTTAQGTMPSLSPDDCRVFLDRLQDRLCAHP